MCPNFWASNKRISIGSDKDFAFNFSAFGENFTCTKYADDKPSSFLDKEDFELIWQGTIFDNSLHILFVLMASWMYKTGENNFFGNSFY